LQKLVRNQSEISHKLEVISQLQELVLISTSQSTDERDRICADAIFLAMFMQLFEGAGRSPTSPEQDWFINVTAQPVLTEALASFAIHDVSQWASHERLWRGQTTSLCMTTKETRQQPPISLDN
jgi:hypothetical protein